MLLSGIIPFWLLRSLENRPPGLWQVYDIECKWCWKICDPIWAPFSGAASEEIKWKVRGTAAHSDREISVQSTIFLDGDLALAGLTSGVFPQVCKEHSGSCNFTLEVAKCRKGRNFQRLFFLTCNFYSPVSWENFTYCSVIHFTGT